MTTNFARRLTSVSIVYISLILYSLIGYAANLQQVVFSTVITNPTLNSERANAAVQYHLVNRERGKFFPQVSLRFDYGQEHTESPFALAFDGSNQITLARRESAVTADQLIFDGGFVYNQYKKQQYIYKSAASMANQSAEATILATVRAYVDVLRYKRIIEFSKINVSNHLETLHNVRTLYHGRFATKGDVSLALSRLALAKTRLQQAIALYQRARADYLKVTGTLPPPNMEKPLPPFDKVPKLLAVAEQIASSNNPILAAARANVIAAEKNAKSARALFYPQVHFILQATNNQNLDGVRGPNNDALASVNVSYDIFRGGSDLANYRAAVNEKIKAIYQEEEVHRDVFRDLHDSWVELHSTSKELLSLTQYVNQSKIVVRVYMVQYELGKRALFNLLDQERELFQSQVAYTNAYYDREISVYRIIGNMGGLRNYFTSIKM